MSTVFNLQHRYIARDGRKVSISPKAAGILEIVALRCPRRVPFDDILDYLYPSPEAEPVAVRQNFMVHAHRINTALQRVGSAMRVRGCYDWHALQLHRNGEHAVLTGWRRA